MIIAIMYITMIIMWLCLVISYGMGAVHNGIYTLGIVLPTGADKSEEVQALLHEYTIKKRVLHLVGFITIVPIVLTEDFVSIMLVYIFVWFFTLMVVYNKVLKKYAWKLYELKKTNNWLVLSFEEQQTGATDDEDIYWLQGKKNPNRKAGFQEKRIGYGLELNCGSKVDYIVLGVVLLFVLGLAIFMLKFDLATVTMEKQGDRISIEAADMGESFLVSRVREVTLLTECPSMSKKHGYNGGKFNFGTFHVTGIGSCEVYVYTKTDQAIEVTTDKDTIIFNMETEEKTKEAYHQLKEWIK